MRVVMSIRGMRMAVVVTMAITATAEQQYARDIQPIFAASCYACHGPKAQLGGLRLDDRAAEVAKLAVGAALPIEPPALISARVV